MKRPARPLVAIVGAGRLARAFERALCTAGYTVRLARSRPPAPLRAAVGDARLVLLAVPDSAVRATARRLAREVDGWSGRVALHHAGALGPEALDDLRALGAAAGVLHPLQSLASPAVAARTLPGSAARIDGDPRAVRAAQRLARDLKLRPLRFAKRLRPEGRAAYHAAASLVANDLVALLRIGTSLFEELGIDAAEAARALARLAAGVAANVEALGLEAALTGPVVRGDAETLEAQLGILARKSPDARQAHRALSAELIRLAELRGRISTAQARKLRRLLRAK